MNRLSAMTRLVAALACIGLTLTVAACSSRPATESNVADDTASDSGSVALFMPSDGLTIAQRTALNTWAKLTSNIVSLLRKHGVDKDDIDTFTADSADKQSLNVQDWVVSRTTDAKAVSSQTTLIVAPVRSNASLKGYGDYVTQSPTGADGGKAQRRLRSALQLARKSGFHVILIANAVQGFAPDLFVRCSTPWQIGQLQAKMLVSKLNLQKATANNPKAIEVLLPYDQDDGGASEAFAKEAFKGLWKVLKPYYEQGRAYSPSDTLSKDSTDDGWNDIAFDASKDGNAKEVLEERLPLNRTDENTTRTRIDGIIALNDATAAEVTDELTELGYSGSAADINPSITIPGILGNIVGNKDLIRDAVPDPAESPQADSTSQAADESRNRWPIVTGFGAYVDNLQQVVNGKQWMTGLENRQALADDIARATVHLNRGKRAKDIRHVTESKLEGVKGTVPTIREDLLAVSAANLKATLIDTGYISMADAGL